MNVVLVPSEIASLSSMSHLDSDVPPDLQSRLSDFITNEQEASQLRIRYCEFHCLLQQMLCFDTWLITIHLPDDKGSAHYLLRFLLVVSNSFIQIVRIVCHWVSSFIFLVLISCREFLSNEATFQHRSESKARADFSFLSRWRALLMCVLFLSMRPFISLACVYLFIWRYAIISNKIDSFARSLPPPKVTQISFSDRHKPRVNLLPCAPKKSLVPVAIGSGWSAMSIMMDGAVNQNEKTLKSSDVNYPDDVPTPVESSDDDMVHLKWYSSPIFLIPSSLPFDNQHLHRAAIL